MGKFKHRNFRRSIQANGEPNRADSAVDVELPAGFFEPSAGVGRNQAAEREAAVDELERQLAAVGVPGQTQIDAQLGGAVETVGVVAQKDVDRVRQDQLLDAPKICSRRQGRAFVPALEIHAIKLRLSPCDRIEAHPPGAESESPRRRTDA